MMADDENSVEQAISAVGLAVSNILQQVQAAGVAGVAGVKVESSQNDDDENSQDDWAQDEEAYDAAIRQIESIDLTQDEDSSLPVPGGEPTDESLRCAHSEKGIRNPCLCGTHEDVLALPHPREVIQVMVGKVYALEAESRIGRYHIDFVEVMQIWKHRRNGSIVVRGSGYARTRNLDGRLQPYQNELCRIIEIDTNDHRPEHEQCLIEVMIDDLRPQVRVLHQTNKSFPECRFDPNVYVTKQQREHEASLTCRWVLAMLYPDKRFRRAQRPIDGEWLAHLSETNVPRRRHRTIDTKRLETWRGETFKGGSYRPFSAKSAPDAATDKHIATRQPKYNAADMFSGAGGYTTGATSAGIKVERAVDHWARCNATYKANHPKVELYEVDIMAYCNDLTIPSQHFDLVHMSPPCQVFSPAHTCVGKNDPANIAALSACEHIVFLTRPRIVTFEQTFGIIQERHLPLFNALLQSLTKYGYSLKWKVISLVDYGLPQNRKRLIMIGAAPGEALPPFPEPTHVAEPQPGDGKRRFVSAVKACWGLVEGVSMHNPSEVKHMERIQWDGTQPMNRTITTSGGQAYHWEGERDLTLAEFARLQGFPEGYKFKAPCIKKQIGNAFPPIVVTAIMKQIVHWLEQVDGVSSRPNEEHIVAIEDDGDDADDGGHHEGHYDYIGGASDDSSAVKQEDVITIEDDAEDGLDPSSEDYSNGCGSSNSSRGGGAGLFSHEFASSPEHIQAPAMRSTTSKEPDLVAMTPEQRAQWIAEHPPPVDFYDRLPRRRSSGSATTGQGRRRSDGSVVYTGQRCLPLIIEDDDDETDGGSGSVAFRGAQAHSGSSAGQGALTTAQEEDNEEDNDSGSSSGNFDSNDIQRSNVPQRSERRSHREGDEAPHRPSAPRPDFRHGHVGSHALNTGGNLLPRSAGTRYSTREIANMTEEELAAMLGIDDNDNDRRTAAGLCQPQTTCNTGTEGPLSSPTVSPSQSNDSVDRLSSCMERDMLGHRLERDCHTHGPSHGRNRAMSASHTEQAAEIPLQTDFSEWQHEGVTEDDAMAQAMELSMRDVQRREQTENQEVVAGDSKGEGRGVAKRSFDDGADDAESGSPTKKSRIK